MNEFDVLVRTGKKSPMNTRNPEPYSMRSIHICSGILVAFQVYPILQCNPFLSGFFIGNTSAPSKAKFGICSWSNQLISGFTSRHSWLDCSRLFMTESGLVRNAEGLPTRYRNCWSISEILLYSEKRCAHPHLRKLDVPR